MWSSIALATARRLRLASVRRTGQLTAELTHPHGSITTSVAVRVATALSRRHFSATRRRPYAAATAKKPAPKKTTKATKKPAAKKKPAKKKAVAKKKPVPRKKRELTDEEKTKLKIRQLKKDALIGQEPKPLPGKSAWMVYMSEHTGEIGTDANATENLTAWTRKLSDQFRSLPQAEIDRLNRKLEANTLANEVALKKWLADIPVEQVATANTARSRLRRMGVLPRQTKPIKDDRLPKKTGNVYSLFVQSRWQSGDYRGMQVPEAMRKIADDWKALSEAEREPFKPSTKSPSP